jgi:hypothetical protein
MKSIVILLLATLMLVMTASREFKNTEEKNLCLKTCHQPVSKCTQPVDSACSKVYAICSQETNFVGCLESSNSYYAQGIVGCFNTACGLESPLTDITVGGV